MYVLKIYIKLLTKLLKEQKVTFCCVWMYIYIYIYNTLMLPQNKQRKKSLDKELYRKFKYYLIKNKKMLGVV